MLTLEGVSTIRPPVWPQVPSQSPGGARPVPDAARAAAQKAFFEAALGRTSAPQATAPAAPAAQPQAAPPAIHVTRLNATPVGNDEPPQRILRPGSLLNILV